MPVKKKVTKPKEEEQRSPVTQVVEVVEEQDESTHTAVAEPPAPETPLEEPSLPPDPVSKLEDEKRRVLVDELFQKNPKREESIVPEISVHRKSPKRGIVTWAIIVIVASLVVGGVIMVVSGKSGSFPSFILSPSPTPTSTPTPTPTPDLSQLDRSTLSVQVLNGSGVAGAAGKIKDVLEEKGYTVKDTANAETYDYTSTEIMVKKDKEAYLTLLEEDLKEAYSLGTAAASLTDDVPYDVRIIVGKE